MSTLLRSDLDTDQLKAISFIKDKGRCGLFLDMGMGKTVISLTAAKDFLDDLAVLKVLVIAPLRVANTVWAPEAKKWDHTVELSVGIATGSISERRRVLFEKHDITVINRENIKWLVDNFEWSWDMVIIDESSSFKAFKAKRFKALKKIVKHISKILLLTGTPASNGQMDLWSQMFLIDQGERLCRTITNYRSRYFDRAYNGWGWDIKDGSAETIAEKISDVCLSMSVDRSKSSRTINEYVDLPPEVMKQYKELEKEFYIELEDRGIAALTAGVLSNKLIQVCNGAIYDNKKQTVILHDEKIDRLKQIVEDNQGENFFVAYIYKSDLERLKKAFPYARTLSRSGEEMEEWNDGKIRMLLAHPASAGHGLNAQYGGSIVVWFGITWSLELYQQFNARLDRQGQTKMVRILRIMARGTKDEEVGEALAGKAKTQADLLAYIKSANL